MKYEDLLMEAKKVAERNDKANAARARSLAKVAKVGFDRNDENSRKRTVTLAKVVKTHDERSEKRCTDIKKTVTDDGDKTRDLITRTSGYTPCTLGQWLAACVIALLVGIIFFCILYFGAKSGAFLSTAAGVTVVRDTDGNFLNNVKEYIPYMPAIWGFTGLMFVAGLLVPLGLFNIHNAKHS